jgi:hypothetical protein
MQEMRGGRKSELKTSRAEQTGLYSPGRQTLPKRASSDTIGPQPSRIPTEQRQAPTALYESTEPGRSRQSPQDEVPRTRRYDTRGEVRRHDGGGQTDSLLLISTHIRIIRTSPRRRKIPRSRCPDLNQPIPIRKTADRHGPLAQKEDWVSGWWRRPSADLRPRRLRTV